jgi:predicted nucleotidyltransferase
LGKIRDTIEGEGDMQLFSLQKFLRLAAEGQSVALEMLFSNRLFISSPIWDELVRNRHRFLSKKMKSFMDFSKAQAAKYSYRADRLNDLLSLRKFLRDWVINISAPILGCDPLDAKLSVLWDILPEGVNFQKSTNRFNRSKDNRIYLICGRELQVHCSVSHILQFLGCLIDEYGERVKKAAEQKVDTKSLSHAFRVSYQARQLVLERNLTFPAREVQFLRQVKFGQLDLIKDKLDSKLDDLINEIDKLVLDSNLPDEVDWAWCEEFILKCYN